MTRFLIEMILEMIETILDLIETILDLIETILDLIETILDLRKLGRNSRIWLTNQPTQNKTEHTQTLQTNPSPIDLLTTTILPTFPMIFTVLFWLKCWRKMLTFWFWLTVSKKLTQNADVLWFLADRCQNEVADWHSKKQRSNRSLDLWKATDTLSVIIRSHHGEDTASHPNCEVKRHWAQAVLRLGTTRELWVMNVLPKLTVITLFSYLEVFKLIWN